jgi:hypothetical protein
VPIEPDWFPCSWPNEEPPGWPAWPPEFVTPVLFAGLPGMVDELCIDDDVPVPVVLVPVPVPELEDEPVWAFNTP